MSSSVRKAQMSNKLPMNIQCTPSVLKGQVPNKSLVSSINAETDKLAVNSPQVIAHQIAVYNMGLLINVLKIIIKTSRTSNPELHKEKQRKNGSQRK
ncbi:hypothetical protein NQ317_018959 [Molorchus minor]|uniref:Uncharacterized protein n=1 Tax=Molorchus minor TaxID=1323400 RepID=A0ABQ9JIQ2_9CUCU|nr:hypothetical protein NQ317_018959 [Molorchus minor]